MNISTALSIQPGPATPLGGALATGAGAAFAALIGGGLLKPMPILVPADPAASGGQAGAVTGNPLPLEAPEMGPDILVAQPAAVIPAAYLPSTLPAAGSLIGLIPSPTAQPGVAPGGPGMNAVALPAVPLTEPDRAPDILVAQNAPTIATSTGDQPAATDDALVLRGRAERFCVAKSLPTLVRKQVAASPLPGGVAIPAASAAADAQAAEPRRDVDGEGSATDPAPPTMSMPVVDPVQSGPPAIVAAAPIVGRERDIDASGTTNDPAPTPIRLAGTVQPDPGTIAATAALPAPGATKDVEMSPPTDDRASPPVPVSVPAPVMAPTLSPTPGPVVADAPAPLGPVPDRSAPPRGAPAADPGAVPLAAAPVTTAPSRSLDIAAPPIVTDSAAALRPTAPVLSPMRADEAVTVPAEPVGTIDQPRQSVPEARGQMPLAAAAQPPVAVLPPPLSSSLTPLAAGAIAPAGTLFADAIHAAGRLKPDPSIDAVPTVPAPTATAIAAVAPAGGNADRSLDLGHPGWPGAMIEHIERLRDAADAVDTRIRLVPDALGGIDVSLRRHDDGVRVTLAADQPATQAMLAEARPRLDAMAEARGIRLADAATGGTAGNSGGDPSSAHRQPRPAAFIPAAPARATTTDTLDPADGRVA